MSNNLLQLIFDQFIDLVIEVGRKTHCCVDRCAFDFRLHEIANSRMLQVIYLGKDECCRQRDICIRIDITNICLHDLTTCKWVNYLTKMAVEFSRDICPVRMVIIRDDPRPCRKQPERWEPLPCANVTTIVRRELPPQPEPECEVVIENNCECIPVCRRERCVPKNKVVIRYDTTVPSVCGDYTVLAKDKPCCPFNSLKGNMDFNNHNWKPCCNSSPQELTYYEAVKMS